MYFTTVLANIPNTITCGKGHSTRAAKMTLGIRVICVISVYVQLAMAGTRNHQLFKVYDIKQLFLASDMENNGHSSPSMLQCLLECSSSRLCSSASYDSTKQTCYLFSDEVPIYYVLAAETRRQDIGFASLCK